MAVSFYGTGIAQGAKSFGKLVQEVHATDKGVTTNSGNYYADWGSASNSYTAGLTICSATITTLYASTQSKLIVTANGWVSEDPNDDGPSGLGISFVNSTSGSSGWASFMPRGRMTYSAYNEGIGDGGHAVLAVIDNTFGDYAAGSVFTIYFKAWSIYNLTRTIKTGFNPAAYGQFTQSSANGAVACRSTMFIQEILTS